jgi:thiosulfate/3-mercaptopyruvate sulfurtransferase
MDLTKLRVIAVVVLVIPVAIKAQEASSPRPQLITHDELQKRLSDPKLRLLDARTKAEYDQSHIPGAVWIDAKAAQTLAARPGGLTDRASWEAWSAPLGINPQMDVFVYDGKRQLDAARIWWLLRYLGVDQVGLVDGNFLLWQWSGKPVTSDPASAPPQPLKIAFRADRHATREEVLAVLKKGTTRIVDARSKAEYAGHEKLSRRAGHIPAACHLEWAELVDKDGRFLSPGELRARLGRLGIKPGEPVIAHCQGGGRASVDTFALERLGVPTRNYYLGWSDWGNTEETPVTTNEDRRP